MGPSNVPREHASRPFPGANEAIGTSQATTESGEPAAIAAGTDMAAGAARPAGGMLVGGLLVLAIGVATALALEDVSEFLEVARGIRSAPLALGILATGCAYLAFLATLVASARCGGVNLRTREVMATSFVSEAINNLLSAGGIGGLAIRIFGLGRRGVPAGVTVGISIMSTLFGDLMMLVALHLGLAHLLSAGRLQGMGLGIVAALYASLVFLGVASIRGLRDPAQRIRLSGWLNGRAEALARRVRRGDLVEGEGLTRFKADFSRFARTVFSNPRRLLAPGAFAFLDYSMRIACLAAAFAAVGYPLSPSVLVTGYAVGLTAGYLSLIPGGLGVMDGSMSAAFAFMGVPLPVAATAVVVFRFSYYVFPLALSVVFFRGLIRGNAAPAT